MGAFGCRLGYRKNPAHLVPWLFACGDGTMDHGSSNLYIIFHLGLWTAVALT